MVYPILSHCYHNIVFIQLAICTPFSDTHPNAQKLLARGISTTESSSSRLRIVMNRSDLLIADARQHVATGEVLRIGNSENAAPLQGMTNSIDSNQIYKNSRIHYMQNDQKYAKGS